MNASLLLVDDDNVFREVLAGAMAKRGYAVMTAGDVETALIMTAQHAFSYAIVDLRMPGPSGLTLIGRLTARYTGIRVVVLTGYASIATAVEAIKLGAIHYLTKPADADEIIAAFGKHTGVATTAIPTSPPSVDRLVWEHIHKVIVSCGGNLSEAARQLGLHRRTLQRKLWKRPVRH